jgi:hypothetical protein
MEITEIDKREILNRSLDQPFPKDCRGFSHLMEQFFWEQLINSSYISDKSVNPTYKALFKSRICNLKPLWNPGCEKSFDRNFNDDTESEIFL